MKLKHVVMKATINNISCLNLMDSCFKGISLNPALPKHRFYIQQYLPTVFMLFMLVPRFNTYPDFSVKR